MSHRDHYVRADYAVGISSASDLRVAMPGSMPVIVAEVEGRKASQLWQALSSPVRLAALSEISGLPVDELQQAIERLVGAGAVRATDASRHPTSSRAPRRDVRRRERVVLGVCGCAQAIFTADLVQRLLSGLTRRLDVVLTPTAHRLVADRALVALGARVWSDLWDAAPGSSPPHIDLAESADLVLVLPASARALFSLGNATCDDLLGLVVAATKAPVVLVPSMNTAMWTNPTVQENADRCRRSGMILVEPGYGRTLADRSKEGLGAAGIGPSTPGIVSLLSFLAEPGGLPPATT